MQKTVAKIYLENIRRNAKAFAKLCGVPVCAVVKADAYGHGAEEVACALQNEVALFAVSLLDEAVAIKIAACGKDILVLTPPLNARQVLYGAQNAFLLTVGDLVTAHKVVEISQNYALPVRVHLKVNTGMNRYGMNVQTLGRVCKLFLDKPLIRVEGLYSHLFCNTRDLAEKQRAAFLQMQSVCKRYFPQIQCHLSATYGALLGEEFAFDFVRVGIGLYGYLPDGAQDITQSPRLHKAMTVYAPVATTRTFTGGGVGYGGEISERKGERVSVLRVGYADGFLRKRQNGLYGVEHNANNLCMDACLRFGKYQRGRLVPVMTDAAKTARQTGTISYEVLCAATRRAERVYE